MTKSLFNHDISINKIREQYFIQQLQEKYQQSVTHGDKSEEFAGIDYKINGQTFDMKWTDIRRPTYAVEISYLNSYNQLKLGWFIDDSHVTDVAIFVEADPQYEQIHAFMFNLAELRQLIYANISKTGILQAHNELKQAHQTRQNLTQSGLRLVWTPSLKESPVNLVIPQTWYQQLPSYQDISSTFGQYSDYLDFVDLQK